MVRGINRSKIFKDRNDKVRFLERFGKNVIEGQCSVYAWVLMDNHVHILLKSGKDGVSRVMRRQLTWYAQYYNHHHNRTGHLFENRFKSILCEEDRYLIALIRYIHLNPIRARIVTTISELDRYPWSGHSAVMGRERHDWMDTEYVLRQFGGSKKAARKSYHQFVAEGLNMGKVPELTGGGLIRSKGGWSEVLSARRLGQREEADERILGSGDFVSGILEEAEEKAARQLRIRRSGATLDSIVKEECEKGAVSAAEIRNGGRRKTAIEVRRKIAKRGVDELGLSFAEIARQVGVSTSGIAKAFNRAGAEV